MTASRVREVFTRLLRSPAPSPERIAEEVTRVLRRKETARIYKWNKAFPGVHVDGPQSWLYPIQPPS